MRTGVTAAAASAALLMLAACSRAPENPARADAEVAPAPAVESQAVAALTATLQAQLDARSDEAEALLSRISSEGGSDFDSIPEPQDWWLWTRGLIMFGGLDPQGRPRLVISPSGSALVSKPATWLKAAPTVDPASTCGSGAGSVVARECTIKASYELQLTPQGRAAFGQVQPPPLLVSATVRSDGKAWTAEAPSFEGGADVPATFQKLISPPPETAEQARRIFIEELRAKMSEASTFVSQGENGR